MRYLTVFLHFLLGKYILFYFFIYFTCAGLAYAISLVTPVHLSQLAGVLCILVFMMFSGANPTLSDVSIYAKVCFCIKWPLTFDFFFFFLLLLPSSNIMNLFLMFSISQPLLHSFAGRMSYITSWKFRRIIQLNKRFLCIHIRIRTFRSAWWCLLCLQLHAEYLRILLLYQKKNRGHKAVYAKANTRAKNWNTLQSFPYTPIRWTPPSGTPMNIKWVAGVAVSMTYSWNVSLFRGENGTRTFHTLLLCGTYEKTQKKTEETRNQEARRGKKTQEEARRGRRRIEARSKTK